MRRVALSIAGAVQGVGFRPFVLGAARRHRLGGWVRNERDGVHLEVEGSADAVGAFVETLRREPPPPAQVAHIAMRELTPTGTAADFRILPSRAQAAVRAALPADLAACSACRVETATPGARRHRYPFTTCARCGPRYSIVERLPYDRARTTMRGFPLCAACAAEYADPAERRFHAETIACPACGPVLRLLAADGRELARGASALDGAAAALAAGAIVALKGLGGFQLLTDATCAAAVARLRARKRRGDKPFAVMFRDLDAIAAACEASPAAAEVLASPVAPIVLLPRRPAAGARVAAAVAPGNPRLGVVLPTTPLHHLLLAAVGLPLVCTSGNHAEEPICTNDAEALVRLGAIADCFLVHDRPIVRPVDDSVVRIGPDGPQVLRRARGFAPAPLRMGAPLPCVLAVGAQQKSTVALSVGSEIVVSQHLGDLHTPAGVQLLAQTVEDLVGFFGVRPTRVACDLHPDYAATRLAERLAMVWDVPLERVQHHHAHVAACVAEHGLTGPVLGLAWDGAGLGPDGVLWGGEALVVDGAAARRVAHLRPFRLPGGDAAVREPRRAALGVLHALHGEEAAARAPGFAPAEAALLCAALARGVNAPVTTAMGRLFDALAALAGVRLAAGFEGEAAMALEFAADAAGEVAPYPLPLADGVPAVADWGPLVAAALADRTAGASPATIAARFHAALVDLAETIAVRAGLARVVLTGGCFQNWRLADQTTARLRARGFTVYLPQAYPPNDGGIALGQLAVAAHRARSQDPRDRAAQGAQRPSSAEAGRESGHAWPTGFGGIGAAQGAQRPSNARPPKTAEAGRESGHAWPTGFGGIGAAQGAQRPSNARPPKTAEAGRESGHAWPTGFGGIGAAQGAQRPSNARPPKTAEAGRESGHAWPTGFGGIGAAQGAQRPSNARPPKTAEAGRESGHAWPTGFGGIGAAQGAQRPSNARPPKTAEAGRESGHAWPTGFGGIGAAQGAQRPSNARPPKTAEAGRESGHAWPTGFGGIGAAQGAQRPSSARTPKR